MYGSTKPCLFDSDKSLNVGNLTEPIIKILSVIEHYIIPDMFYVKIIGSRICKESYEYRELSLSTQNRIQL